MEGHADLRSVACYEKSELEPAVHDSNINGARLLTSTIPSPTPATASLSSSTATTIATSGPSPSCPANNATTYIAANGLSFVLECDIDRPGADLSLVSLAGAVDTWYSQCIETCANTTGCVDVSLSGSKPIAQHLLQRPR